jgi:hypothetical protein
MTVNDWHSFLPLSLFKDAPAYKEIFAEGFVQGIQQEIDKSLASQRITLENFRELFVKAVIIRFPSLKSLAKTQVSRVHDLEQIHKLLPLVANAPNPQKAKEILLHLHEENDETKE